MKGSSRHIEYELFKAIENVYSLTISSKPQLGEDGMLYFKEDIDAEKYNAMFKEILDLGSKELVITRNIEKLAGKLAEKFIEAKDAIVK